MTSSSDVSGNAGDRTLRTSATVITLYIAALISFLLGVVPAVAALDERVTKDNPLEARFVLVTALSILAGVAIGGVLLACGSIVGCLQRQGKSGGANRGPAPATDPLADFAGSAEPSLIQHDGNGSGGALGDSLKQVQLLLREVRDLTVVGSDERASVHERIRDNLRLHSTEEIIDAINRRNLGRARALLTDAEATYGSAPTFERLAVKIEEADKRAEPLDYARTKRLVEQCIATHRWSEAESLVQSLCVNHPQSARSRQLWDDARQARLFAHVQQCASDHHWAEAVAAAEEFLERFPDSHEAKALRHQLDTLKENAEIVQRRQLEGRITDLLSAQHYDEALRVARHVVDTFPNSPQAEALREQLPKLEKRVTA